MGSRLLTDRHQDWTYARTFADTCYFSYDYTISGVGAEIITFRDSYQHRPVKRAETARPLMLSDGITNSNPIYIGRPEAIESIFYMYRMTGDEQWRDKGWRMFMSWVRHCQADFGMASLKAVNKVPLQQHDSQESFVFAETFKYYYLLFSEPDFLSLDEWVLSTEAHPFSLKDKTGPVGGFWQGQATDQELKDRGKGTSYQILEKYNRQNHL